MPARKQPRPQLPPYHDILQDLVKSTMRAQAELVASQGEVSHKKLNRHFAWLPIAIPKGTNRHFFEALNGNNPLRKKRVKPKNSDPSKVKRVEELLERREALPVEGDSENSDLIETVESLGLVAPLPTRISSLIVIAHQDVGRSKQRANEEEVFIRSPLSIVSDILTSPEMPGSRGYALLTLRNFLFETFGTFPDLNGVAKSGEAFFNWKSIEEGLSHIWTSLRPRFYSQGEDKLPPEGRKPVDGLLRHFLGQENILWLFFPNEDRCVDYLRAGEIRSSLVQFTKSPLLERFPELSQLINELWGLPIPIRGADTLFCGGLKFSQNQGLVMALHGGPGTGKTSLALALGAFLSPFDIPTLFLTSEEDEEDLKVRAETLLPDELRRMSFFPKKQDSWLTIARVPLDEDMSAMDFLEDKLIRLRNALEQREEEEPGARGAPKVCKAIVVLDGLHDLLRLRPVDSETDQTYRKTIEHRLRDFVGRCRQSGALIILTTGENWDGNGSLDYMVDVAARLTFESMDEYGQKPDRRITLTKARHQLYAAGTHGIQIAGEKGVRFSPQINYQLDRRKRWITRIPDESARKTVLQRVTSQSVVERWVDERRRLPPESAFVSTDSSVYLPRGSNIFLNGRGSGGKAALALKIAMAPAFSERNGTLLPDIEKVLVVSFLYPNEYYQHIRRNLGGHLRQREYASLIAGRDSLGGAPVVNVIHLYPGYLKPNDLFNRIEWELERADLHGQPYTSVVVDGIHNTYLQFPEIEKHVVFWPQLYSALRTRKVTIVTTHTTFALPAGSSDTNSTIDDGRSEPLRHALVQRTDFRLEIMPHSSDRNLEPDQNDRPTLGQESTLEEPDIFQVKVVSTINQPTPNGYVLWSRRGLVLFEDDKRIKKIRDREIQKSDSSGDRLL